jgi:hypothetical protein
MSKAVPSLIEGHEIGCEIRRDEISAKDFKLPLDAHMKERSESGERRSFTGLYPLGEQQLRSFDRELVQMIRLPPGRRWPGTLFADAERQSVEASHRRAERQGAGGLGPACRRVDGVVEGGNDYAMTTAL